MTYLWLYLIIGELMVVVTPREQLVKTAKNAEHGWWLYGAAVFFVLLWPGLIYGAVRRR